MYLFTENFCFCNSKIYVSSSKERISPWMVFPSGFFLGHCPEIFVSNVWLILSIVHLFLLLSLRLLSHLYFCS
jgi:hypothetical protein